MISVIISMMFYCFPFISIPLIFIGIIFDKKHSFIYALLLALIFALIAYNFNPNDTHDLYRYYFEMKYYYSNLNFDKFIMTAMSNSKITFSILQYIFAGIGNYHLLTFFITLIGYTISFYIILDYNKIKKYPSIVSIIILLIFIFTFYHINFISGLAQYLAISIAFLGFYLEFIKNKKKLIYKLLYIIPIFIHISMIIIPIIRLILNFDFKKIKSTYIFILIVYMFFPSVFYFILSQFSSTQLIANKINSYMVIGEHHLYTMYDLFTLVMLIFYLIIFILSKNKFKEEIPHKFINLIEIILLINSASIFYRDIFTRFLNLTILCMIIYFSTYLSKSKMKSVIIVLFILLIICICLGSVSINIFINNDFSNIFSNIFKNFNYFLK